MTVEIEAFAKRYCHGCGKKVVGVVVCEECYVSRDELARLRGIEAAAREENGFVGQYSVVDHVEGLAADGADKLSRLYHGLRAALEVGP